MIEGNLTALLSLVLGSIAIILLVFYLIPKQLSEVMRPKDWLTGLRWQIFALLGLMATMSIPSLVYQSLRFLGQDAEALRNLATITSRLSFVAAVVILMMVSNYRRKE